MPKNVSMNLEITAKPTFKDLKGRFAASEKDLLETRRDNMRQIGRLATAALREEAPRKTGKYASSIRYITRIEGTNIVMRTQSAQPLGKWIVGGTKPHIIRPVRAKMLRFVVNGKVVFARKVKHPGTKPNLYPQRAYQKIRTPMMIILRKVGTRYTLRLTQS